MIPNDTLPPGATLAQWERYDQGPPPSARDREYFPDPHDAAVEEKLRRMDEGIEEDENACN